MERVQYSLERTLPQLKLLDEHSILSKDELRSVTSQRQGFEARLIRRKAEKFDFVRYIEFEDDLHALIVLRARERNRKIMNRVRAGDEDAKSQLLPRSFLPKQAASSSAQCVAIFERMVRKFRWDLDAWDRYIAWAKKRKMRVVAGRVFARALALHPMHPSLWISAADYELNTQADTTAARALLQRGIRTNKLTDSAALSAHETSKLRKTQNGARASRKPGALRWTLTEYESDVLRLWVEYFRMELVFIERLRRRWRILGLDSGDILVTSDPSADTTAMPWSQREGDAMDDATHAAQSVALDPNNTRNNEHKEHSSDDHFDEEDEQVAAAEAAVDEQVPDGEDNEVGSGKFESSHAAHAPAVQGVRPAADMAIPPGHHQIMNGSIPLVLLENIGQHIPQALQFYLYTALLQLMSSFPFFDSVVVKRHGEVLSIRTSQGILGSGDRLRRRLMQALLSACMRASHNGDTCDGGKLGAWMWKCIHPLYHPFSHDVAAKISTAALPASQAERELDTNALLHGASQLHAVYSPAIDALYAYAQVPADLRQERTVAGTYDPWQACQPVLFLLELLSRRLVSATHTEISRGHDGVKSPYTKTDVSLQETITQSGSDNDHDDDEEARENDQSHADAELDDEESIHSAEASDFAVVPEATPFMRMLTTHGDLPKVIQCAVSLFRAHQGEQEQVPLAFLATLRFLSNPLRSAVDESHLLTYIAQVDAKLVEALEPHVPWLTVEKLSRELRAHGKAAWDQIQSLVSVQRTNPCAWVLYINAAPMWSSDKAWTFKWDGQADSSIRDAQRVWIPILDACTGATHFANDAHASVWALLTLWLGSSVVEDTSLVSPEFARQTLWLRYLDWVRDAATVSPNAKRAKRASVWAWSLYKQAVQKTGAVLASSMLVGTARESAQALHDKVVCRMSAFSLSTAAAAAAAKAATATGAEALVSSEKTNDHAKDDTTAELDTHHAQDLALSFLLANSSASTRCWLEIAHIETMRVVIGVQELDEPCKKRITSIFQRAMAQAEREAQVPHTVDAWLAYLSFLAHTQRDMPQALAELARAQSCIRRIGGAEAAVAFEHQWQQNVAARRS